MSAPSRGEALARRPEARAESAAARALNAEPAAAVPPLRALRADAHRRYGARVGWARLLCGALLERTFRPVVTLRLCQWAAQRRRPVAGRLLRAAHRLATQAAGMDLPWQTAVGPGLALTHGWGLVVNGGARIGSNVTLFHGATLGRNDRIAPAGTRTSACPVIEDEVWIGPHAVVVGGVTVGRGSRIAAGAFVTRDVPPHSLVIGNPASIARAGCAPDVDRRAPL